MKRVLSTSTAFAKVAAFSAFAKVATFAALVVCASTAFGFEMLNVWPSTPPGDKAEQYRGENAYYVPTLEYWAPKAPATDACVIICCGGAYNGVAYEYEGVMPRDFFVERGVAVVMLRYRTPRRPGVEKHRAAWQDVQRTIRIVRSKAADWKISPDKIGVMGFSAGGHLTLMAATSSETAAYSPIDDLDKIPCNVNFAIPVYPAYVLTDGVDGENVGRGNGDDAKLVDDFAFDAQTPPMCFLHGDGDGYSSMGSVAVYRKLRTMNIPAEMHIFSLANHAFRNCGPDAAIRKYPQRVLEWLETIGIVETDKELTAK